MATLLFYVASDINARSSRDRFLGGAGSQNRQVIRVHDFDSKRVKPAQEEENMEEVPEIIEMVEPEVIEEETVFIKRTIEPVVKESEPEPEQVEDSETAELNMPDEITEKAEPFQVIKLQGYLSDKGPSLLKVEKADTSTVQPLDNVIWDLILGDSAYYTKSGPAPQSVNEVSSDSNPIIPGQTNTANDLRLNYQNSSSPTNLSQSNTQNETPANQGQDAVALQDQAESHRQLLDFFSNQVNPFGATPGVNAPFMGYQPSMVGQQPTVRQGSSARFEIRRN